MCIENQSIRSIHVESPVGVCVDTVVLEEKVDLLMTFNVKIKALLVISLSLQELLLLPLTHDNHGDPKLHGAVDRVALLLAAEKDGPQVENRESPVPTLLLNLK